MSNWTDTQRHIVNNLTLQMVEFVNDMAAGHGEELDQMIEARDKMNEIIGTSERKFSENVYSNVVEEFKAFDKLKGTTEEIGQFIVEVSKNRKKDERVNKRG